MGILSNIARWFNNSPAQDSFEKSRDQWKGSNAYTKKRHAWFSREGMCPGSQQLPQDGSVQWFISPENPPKRRKRGACGVCGRTSSVSRKGMIAVHKERS